MAFVDDSLERFLSDLERKGLLDDALVIIYGDHSAGIQKEAYSSDRNFLLKRPIKRPESVPLFILNSNIPSKIETKEGTQVDLAPTILDLLGLEEKPEDFMGHSLLSPIEKPILFLHELPQLLHKGQLFTLSPLGLEEAGYRDAIGKKDVRISEDSYSLLLEYIRNIMLERRNDLD